MTYYRLIISFCIWVLALFFLSKGYPAPQKFIDLARKLNDEKKIISHSNSFKKFISCFKLDTSDDISPYSTSSNANGSESHRLNNNACDPISPKDIVDIIYFSDEILRMGYITKEELLRILNEEVSIISKRWFHIVDDNFQEIRKLLQLGKEQNLECCEGDTLNEIYEKDNVWTGMTGKYLFESENIWPWLINLQEKYPSNSRAFFADTMNTKTYQINDNSPLSAAVIEDVAKSARSYYRVDLLTRLNIARKNKEKEPEIVYCKNLIRIWIEVYSHRMTTVAINARIEGGVVGHSLNCFFYCIGMDEKYLHHQLNFESSVSVSEGKISAIFSLSSESVSLTPIFDADDFCRFRSLILPVPEVVDILNNHGNDISKFLETPNCDTSKKENGECVSCTFRLIKEEEKKYINYWNDFRKNYLLLASYYRLISYYRDDMWGWYKQYDLYLVWKYSLKRVIEELEFSKVYTEQLFFKEILKKVKGLRIFYIDINAQDEADIKIFLSVNRSLIKCRFEELLGEQQRLVDRKRGDCLLDILIERVKERIDLIKKVKDEMKTMKEIYINEKIERNNIVNIDESKENLIIINRRIKEIENNEKSNENIEIELKSYLKDLRGKVEVKIADRGDIIKLIKETRDMWLNVYDECQFKSVSMLSTEIKASVIQQAKNINLKIKELQEIILKADCLEIEPCDSNIQYVKGQRPFVMIDEPSELDDIDEPPELDDIIVRIAIIRRIVIEFFLKLEAFFDSNLKPVKGLQKLEPFFGSNLKPVKGLLQKLKPFFDSNLKLVKGLDLRCLVICDKQLGRDEKIKEGISFEDKQLESFREKYDKYSEKCCKIKSDISLLFKKDSPGVHAYSRLNRMLNSGVLVVNVNREIITISETAGFYQFCHKNQ